MGYTIPFTGDIWYQVETVYNTKPSTVSLRISDKVTDVRIESGEVVKGLRGIDSPSICGYIGLPYAYTLHVEWVLQPMTANSLASLCVNRTSTSDVASMSFSIINNANVSGASSFFVVTGAKCKTLRLSTSRGNEVICAADFSCASIISTPVAFTGAPAKSGNAFAAFNAAGSINYWGSTTRFFITDSLEITVDNNMKEYWDCDSRYMVTAIPGALDITGVSDVTIEDGGAAMWGIITTQSTTVDLTSIIYTTGLTGLDDTWTMSNIRFPEMVLDLNISGDIQLTSQRWTAKSITLS